MKNQIVYILTFLRIIIGWHFLYEGIAKVINPGWSAEYYLMGSRWIFSDIFQSIAASPALLQVVDFLNTWGLILIGISLMAGLLVRISSAFGAIMLLMYFVAYPPIPGYTLGVVTEGSYLWINKTFIEMIVLVFFAFLPVIYTFGVDRLYKKWKDEKARTPVPSMKETTSLQRRELLRDMIGLPFLGAFAYAAYKKKQWDSFEEKFLDPKKTDATSGATLKTFNFSTMNDFKGPAPKGKIGDMELCRIIMGGNLIGGWAHSRDLIYVSKLVKAYHTDERVIATMQLAEQCGIDAILTNPQLARIVMKYRRETGGVMKFISDCGVKDGFIEGVKQSLDSNADALYCQGEIADRLVKAGNYEDLVKGIDMIRKAGKPAGIGAHRIETIMGCVEQGIKPDFWVKTLHHHNYWSAQPNAEWKDNMYCFKPQDTIDYMNSLEEPWIAFKVLAAGAIKPQEGFQYAFNNGADFICVGMYDFQIVEDVNMVNDSLAQVNRIRPWRA
ncbi:MAG TPA: DoxX family membrane protein [Mariniphaga sp.]|nr:DoxX family membrane protein [Mariniphaga sp.]